MSVAYSRVPTTRLIILGSCLLTAGAAVSGQPNILTDAESTAGWQLLFDGQTTDGWRGFGRDTCPDGWQARDGALARVAPGGYIVSDEQFDDFELQFEWKVAEGGNSGLFFNVQEADGVGSPGACGPEFQVLDNYVHVDGKRTKTSAGANYALHAPIRDVTQPVGQWNRCRVVVRGNHVEHWMNDVQLLEYELGSDDWKQRVASRKFKDFPDYSRFDRGHLALQDHGDSVWYRNIKIRPTDQDELFVARPLTEQGSFTGGVEGPACDVDGNVYAVNFAEQGTIGRVTPDGQAEVFLRLPEGSVGNGIRFDRAGTMYVADYPQHNVLRVDPATREVTVHAHDDGMNQPNDLTITADGVLYASDPNWGEGTGQLWRIDRDGTTTRLTADMGTTNGVEVSPDGKRLYVAESVQRNVWALDITTGGGITNKRLIRKFDDFGFDGMRCDVDGNLYLTRHGKGTVIKMTPDGEILQEINVLGAHPTNICFGGPDGRTAYVTEAEQRRIVSFRVDRPGNAWARWQAGE